MITYTLKSTSPRTVSVRCFSNAGAEMGGFTFHGSVAGAREHMAEKYCGATEIQPPQAVAKPAPTRVAAPAKAKVPAAVMSELELRKELARLERDLTKLSGEAAAPAPAAPAAPAHADRINRAFGLTVSAESSNPCVQTFGIRPSRSGR